VTAHFGLHPKSGQITPKPVVNLLRIHWSVISVFSGQLTPKYAPGEEGIEMGGEHPVERGALRMPLPVE
jgi:hypothetical protein